MSGDRTIDLVGTADAAVALTGCLEGFEGGAPVAIVDGMPMGLLLVLTYAGV